MDDLIRRSDVLEKIQGIGIAAIAAYARINSIPAVGAVEVVRCQECIVPHNEKTGCPRLLGAVTAPDFFCGFGERGKNHDK